MRSTFSAVMVAAFALAIGGVAAAQSAVPRALPSSAPVPAAAASKPIPTRSPAVKAAENAQEPGRLRPEQRVIPQVTLPLKSSTSAKLAAPSASLPVGSVPGTVNDGAARCVAMRGAAEKAACERGLPASGPAKMGR